MGYHDNPFQLEGSFTWSNPKNVFGFCVKNLRTKTTESTLLRLRRSTESLVLLSVKETVGLLTRAPCTFVCIAKGERRCKPSSTHAQGERETGLHLCSPSARDAKQHISRRRRKARDAKQHFSRRRRRRTLRRRKI